MALRISYGPNFPTWDISPTPAGYTESGDCLRSHRQKLWDQMQILASITPKAVLPQRNHSERTLKEERNGELAEGGSLTGNPSG